MKHLEIEVIDEDHQPEGGVQFIPRLSFSPPGLLPRQPLVHLQECVGTTRDSAHRGKPWAHNGGHWILIGCTHDNIVSLVHQFEKLPQKPSLCILKTNASYYNFSTGWCYFFKGFWYSAIPSRHSLTSVSFLSPAQPTTFCSCLKVRARISKPPPTCKKRSNHLSILF